MVRILRIFLIVAVLTGSTAMASAEAPVRANSSQPLEPMVIAKLTPLWQAGDDDLLLGSVDQVLVNAEGNLFLLDARFNDVKVFSPGGDFLRTIGRKGDGPGEFRFGTDLVHLPDGDLGILASMMGTITRINTEGLPTGKPVGSFPLAGQGSTGFSNISEGMTRGGTMVFLLTGIGRQGNIAEQHSSLTSFDDQGKPLVTFLNHVATMDTRHPRLVEKERDFPSGGRWTIGPDGHLFVASDRNSYTVTKINPQGEPVLVITRDFQSWPRSPAEKLAFGADLHINNGSGPVQIDKLPEDNEPCVISVDVLDDGTIWILNSRGVRELPAGVFRVYDVFDEQGIFRQQVALPHPGDGIKDRLFFLGDDRVIIASEYSGSLEVSCFRLGL